MDRSRKPRTSCALCGGTDRTHLFDKDGYPIARCRGCGLVQVDVELDRAELEQIYGEDYFTKEQVLYDYVADRDARLASGARVAQALARVRPGGRLLDVGCAAGFFLAPAAKHYDVTGVEISAFASAYARDEFGLRVHTGDVTEVDFDGTRFDVATIWNTIEHVADPLATVRAIADVTRPGGLLAMSTGSVTGPLARRDLPGWNLMAPPYHLFYFSPPTIDLLLAKAGFRLRRIVYDGIVASGGLLGSTRGRRAAALLGAGNVMTVYATRVDPPPRPSRVRRLLARYVPLRLALSGRA
jgi:SAM-dependent methyltransferase